MEPSLDWLIVAMTPTRVTAVMMKMLDFSATVSRTSSYCIGFQYDKIGNHFSYCPPHYFS